MWAAFFFIKKTYLYNSDHLKPHFYTVKLGFTGVYINFLISAQKHRLWVLVRTASARWFLQVPIYVLSKIRILYESFQFLEVKLSVYLNRHVFLMFFFNLFINFSMLPKLKFFLNIHISCITLPNISCTYLPHITALILEVLKRNKPPHDKANKMACVPSEDSDQPGHVPRLMGVFAHDQWVAKERSLLRADREDSDQTGQMPRLIWVFAGCTCHFVGFVMHWLKYFLISPLSTTGENVA